MVFCGECGTLNPDGSIRCTRCGATIETSVPEYRVNPIPDPPKQNDVHETEPPKRSHHRKTDPCISLGKSSVSGIVRPGSVITGIIVLIIGVVFLVYGSKWDVLIELTNEDLARFVSILLGIIFSLIGFGLIGSGWATSMETVYLKGGRCQIVEGKGACGGGCNSCVFAKRYVELNNPDPNDSDDGRW